nr:MAG TPA: hypothetical protein [Caudoviricetes sp.]
MAYFPCLFSCFYLIVLAVLQTVLNEVRGL